MTVAKIEAKILLSIHRAKLAGFQWVTTRSLAAAHDLSMATASGAVYRLRMKKLVDQPMLRRYAITDRGIEEAANMEGASS